MLTVNKPTPRPLIKFVTGGILKKGQIAVVSANTAVVATEGVTTAIIIGIACDDYASGVLGYFYDLRDAEIEADVYQGGGTDTFALANVGSQFDLYTAGTTNPFFVDPNDTTNPMVVLQSYNNDNATCIVKIMEDLLYI